jgi:drug/metabolite transporter (DMT)-like permease
VVSPVVGAYGGAAVVLAVLLFGEVVSPTQVVAVIAAVAGVVLASVAFDREAMRARVRGPGPALAIVASIGFAVNVMGLTFLIRDYG